MHQTQKPDNEGLFWCVSLVHNRAIPRPRRLTPEQRFERAERWARAKGYDLIASDLADRRISDAMQRLIWAKCYNVALDLLEAVKELEGWGRANS